MPIKPEHLDDLLSGYEKPEDLLGEEGLFKQLKKALLERTLGAELTHHLGYEKGDPAGRGSGNNRNGTYPKSVLTEGGAVEIDVPRDRNSTFEPQIVPKGETRLDGFDDKIISLYARGMTVREIQGHVREMHTVDVSPDLILVTDGYGELNEVNGAHSASWAYAAKKMTGRSGSDPIHPNDLEATRNEMRAARRGGAFRNFGCRYVDRKGRSVSLVWTGVWSEADRQHFFIGRDVTEIDFASRVREVLDGAQRK